MLFQGQEFAASAPFLFFADHAADLAGKVRAGRREFLAQFRSLALPEWDTCFADPADPRDLRALQARPRASASAHGAGLCACTATSCACAARTRCFAARASAAWTARCSARTPSCCASSARDGDDRLLLVNFGRDLHLDPAPEPLLAPPEGADWRVLWSSEDRALRRLRARCHPDTEDNWRLPGEVDAAVLGAGDQR